MTSPREDVPFVVGVLLTTATASMVALFYAGDKSGLWDLFKLALQGLGGLTIAWLTVTWAVENFKSQKRWERDALTFTSVLASLREMKRANDILWADLTHTKDYSKTYVEQAKDRSVLAKKKFEEAATGAIFLPGKISSIILKLEADLANADYDSYDDYLDGEGGLVSDALKALEVQRHLL